MFDGSCGVVSESGNCSEDDVEDNCEDNYEDNVKLVPRLDISSWILAFRASHRNGRLVVSVSFETNLSALILFETLRKP
jgi:hypothetical protein